MRTLRNPSGCSLWARTTSALAAFLASAEVVRAHKEHPLGFRRVRIHTNYRDALLDGGRDGGFENFRIGCREQNPRWFLRNRLLESGQLFIRGKGRRASEFC